MKILKISALILAGLISANILSAQSVADMQQDLALLKREVGSLRLEVEQLSRQNQELSQQIRKAQASSTSNDMVRAQVSSVRSEVSSQNNALKREIVALVKKDIENLASQTDAAIQKLAKAIGSRPQAEMPKTFGNDYPQTGIEYTVQSGDTLGKIARKNNSKVKWIQDANKIADPNRGLRVGEQIFIPQK